MSSAPASIAPSSPAPTESAGRSVVYHGVSIAVPDGWSVVNFDTDPTACLGAGAKHIYVGSESGTPFCPNGEMTSDSVTIQPLSETFWAKETTSEFAVGTVTVNGQRGTYVKSPNLVVFAGLDLFVVLGSPDAPVPESILHSIRQVGPAATSTASRPAKVRIAGLVSAGQGWVVDDRALWLTADSGAHWHSVTPANVGPKEINNVFFLDPMHGWLTVGSSPSSQTGRSIDEIFRTEDGGLTWQSAPVILPPPMAEDFGEVNPRNATVTFVDPLHGWLEEPRDLTTAYSQAVLYRTVDGGATWRTAASAIFGGRMLFTSATQGWISGELGSLPGVYETSDAGLNWRESRWPGEVDELPSTGRQVFLPQHDVMTVQASNAEGTGGPVTFFAAATGSAQWKPIAILPTQAHVQGVAIVNASTWIVVANPSVYATTDAGQHWSSALTNSRMGNLNQLTMANASDGWALLVDYTPGCDPTDGRCTDADLLATHDGGVTWSPLAPGP